MAKNILELRGFSGVVLFQLPSELVEPAGGMIGYLVLLRFWRPFPLVVMTCNKRGPLTIFNLWSSESNLGRLCPSIGPV